MKIETNKNILYDLYEYDIEACYYNILKSLDSNLINNIKIENKFERNKELGKLQIDNKKLSNFLFQKTSSIIDYYLEANDIKPEELIYRVRDGIILSKPMEKITDTLNIKYKGHINIFIPTVKKDKFLAIYSDNHVDVKGVVNKLADMSFYSLFLNLNFNDYDLLFQGINSLKSKIYNSNNPYWFCREIENEYYVSINKKIIKLKKNYIDSMNTDEIDKDMVWDNYIWPFIQPLLIEYGLKPLKRKYKKYEYNKR